MKLLTEEQYLHIVSLFESGNKNFRINLRYVCSVCPNSHSYEKDTNSPLLIHSVNVEISDERRNIKSKGVLSLHANPDLIVKYTLLLTINLPTTLLTVVDFAIID